MDAENRVERLKNPSSTLVIVVGQAENNATSLTGRPKPGSKWRVSIHLPPPEMHVPVPSGATYLPCKCGSTCIPDAGSNHTAYSHMSECARLRLMHTTHISPMNVPMRSAPKVLSRGGIFGSKESGLTPAWGSVAEELVAMTVQESGEKGDGCRARVRIPYM